jgi:tetratricopeptide (TPR) repeat protein/predicted Ser/Thr protein kinase
MESERWERIAQLYDLACERPAAERDAFIAEACTGDQELRREVESLLRQDVSLDGPLERVAEEAGKARPCPTTVGPYRILTLVGEGGMGAVYEAEQDHPRRTVALKVLKSALAGPELLRRFARESEALGRLQHPGIARIYEAGTADTGLGPQPYFAMEFIRGLSLLEYAQTRQLNTRQCLELMVKVSEAADHAHERGIVHRDLKPGNILVDESGQPKILDFGVARIADSDANATRHTNFGDLVGTLAYMSPEQVVADPSQLDARSDVYSLGVVLYELLAGRLPYEVSRQVHEAARAVREEDPARLSAPRDLEIIVRKALEKDKARRYASAAELAGDLRRYLADEPILARPPSAMYQARKFTIRHKALVIAAAAVFLVLLAGITVSTLQAIRARRAEQVANAVNDFLQNDLLAQAGARAQAGAHSQTDPDLKVRTALDRAAERIAGKFDSQPAVEASIRRTIGLAYYNLNLFGKAKQQLERAVDIRKRVLGTEHPDTLTSMDELGVLYNNEGKYAAAEALLTKVSEARQRTLGSKHKDTLAALADLALVVSYKGDDPRAEPLFVKLLEAERRVQGEEHPDTLSVMDNLGTVYVRLGKYPQAAALMEKVVELNRRRLGPEHPDASSSMHNLANVYRLQGNYPRADSLLSAALDARLRTLGEENWEPQNTRFSLGASYRAQGRFAEARSLITQATQTLVRVLGAEHPLTLQAMWHLGELDRRERRFVEAETLFNKVLEARRRVLGPYNPYTAQVLTSLGQLKLEQRAYANAEKLLREAVQAREKESPDTWERYWAQSMLGASLAGLGTYDEAKPLMTSGYQGMLERQSSIPAEYRPALEEARKWAVWDKATKR